MAAPQRVHLDFETRSPVDLRRCGAARYAQDPETEVLCACYSFDDGDTVRSWSIGQSPPADLIEAVAAGSVVVAHNALFELFVWTYVCEPRMGWGALSPYQMECTMARAHVLSLPGALDAACSVLGVPQQKDMTGAAIMRTMCSPRRPRKGEDDTGLRYNFDDGLLRRLVEYCAQDVRAECALDRLLPPLSARERAIYHFDLVVNLRGFRLDTALMRKAEKFVEAAKIEGDARLFALTEGAVTAATKIEALKTWLNGRGIPVETLRKADLEDVSLRAELFDDTAAVEAVEIRRAGAKATSLAKFSSGLRCAGFDERARGLLTYHKASTGRWAGSLYQPHNLERIDPDSDGPLVREMIEILQAPGRPQDKLFDARLLGLSPMAAVGKCTRAMIRARDGHELAAVDYSNVEGRGSVWLAGETWKLDAFRAYDAGTGPDMYKLAYATSFGADPATVSKAQRQIGKVQELALGYQGSVGAFMSMAAALGIKPEDIRKAVQPIAETSRWLHAASRFASTPNTFGLTADQWTALKYVVDAWRDAHPNVVQGWWDLQDAVLTAVSEPGERVRLFDGKVFVYCSRDRQFLHVRLPSRRFLNYYRPRIVKAAMPGDALDENGDPIEDTGRRAVAVEGRDSRRGGNHWSRVQLYGGLLWENIVQGFCRDLLADGLMRCEEAGYPVVLHVHDEGVFEIPEGSSVVEHIRELMSTLPEWAEGFPLSCAAAVDERYVK